MKLLEYHNPMNNNYWGIIEEYWWWRCFISIQWTSAYIYVEQCCGYYGSSMPCYSPSIISHDIMKYPYFMIHPWRIHDIDFGSLSFRISSMLIAIVVHESFNAMWNESFYILVTVHTCMNSWWNANICIIYVSQTSMKLPVSNYFIKA